MSSAVSEAAVLFLILQAIGSRANNPVRGAGQVRQAGEDAGIVKAE